MIALPHITCTTGQVLPIQAISEAFSARVPYLFFDGAHGAGSLELNLKSMGCGFYSTCGHKWLCGPAGSGFLYVNESLLSDLKPIFCGAGSEIGWEASTQRQSLGNWKAGAERFEYGTQNKVVQAGFLVALDFQSEIGLRNISNRLRELNSLLRTKLQALEWLEILTPSLSQQHVGILTIRPKEAMRRPAFVEYMKSRSGFRVREVQESSLQAVRISTHIFNSEKDIENLSSYVSEWKP